LYSSIILIPSQFVLEARNTRVEAIILWIRRTYLCTAAQLDICTPYGGQTVHPAEEMRIMELLF